MAGLDTRSLTLTVGDVEVTAQISSGKITAGDADSDFVSFRDAKQGGARQYILACTGVQDLAEGTFWDFVWSHAGEEIDFLMCPYGNEDPTPAQPHFEGTVVVKEPDGDLIGGDADPSTTARQVIEVEWPCVEKPRKVTA